MEVNKEIIDSFLKGRNPQKYIVDIRTSYHNNEVFLILNDPKKGKGIQKDILSPFLWMKHEAANVLYGGNKKLARRKLNEAKISIKSLQTKNSEGFEPERVANGYRYMLSCGSSYNTILKFLEEGGIDLYGDHKDLFMALSPVEQYMIQTGKRLFKGMEDYNDVHRLQFDIETTGLDGRKDRVFQIGVKDNRGFETILEAKGKTEGELRDAQMLIIEEFFKIIDKLKPDIIAGYNSENFDFKFLDDRCDKLGYNIKDFAKTLSNKKIYFNEKATLKLGQETERYTQTVMWGYNVIDIAHSVRRAQAIDSSIKKWGLKYITQYEGIAKPNRVYIPGDNIYKTWIDDTTKYAFNNTNGKWYKLSEGKELEEGYEEVKGSYITQRYLLDDLWETEQIDYKYNQATFLISKILPTTYSKTSTMGTASIWKLIMAAWSYENNLTVPRLEEKRDFVGGLSRVLEVGYAKNVVKLDYAALYPNIELTHGIFPALDITNAMMNMLLYIAETRDEFKELKNINKRLEEIEKDPTKKKEYKYLKELYDKKQLPLKILANSFFGSFGAPYLFPWGDSDCGEETTCRGRQYFRLLLKFFNDKGFRPLVGDTDGINFSIPDDVDKYNYTSDGSHRFTEKDKEYKGLDAVVAEFNDKFMIGRMGLDVDEIALATINFARKNYADLLVNKKGETEVKLVGNTVKSKKMSGYIEDFLDKSIRMLLEGDGYGFIEYYYEYVNIIYNYQIPLVKIASKAKIKQTIDSYKKHIKKKNKAGNPIPRQAHMELMIEAGLNPDLGETVYYVNTSNVKSHGDLQTKKNKDNNKKEIILNCKLIPTDQIENNPDLTTEEYNVPKYLAAFNKRITPLLVCFHPDIRDKILINVKKDRKTKKDILEPRQFFTKKQAELCAGMPRKEEDQDKYEDVIRMEDKEIYFWIKKENDIKPNNISDEEFQELKLDYLERMVEKRNNDKIEEARLLDDLIHRIEVNELIKIQDGEIPKSISNIVETNIIDDKIYLYSKALKSDKVIPLEQVVYGEIDMLFKYEDDAIMRNEFYKTLDDTILNDKKVDLHELFMEYKLNKENEEFSGGTIHEEQQPTPNEEESEIDEWGF